MIDAFLTGVILGFFVTALTAGIAHLCGGEDNDEILQAMEDAYRRREAELTREIRRMNRMLDAVLLENARLREGEEDPE